MARNTWAVAVAFTVLVASACGDSAIAPNDDVVAGSAAFARNGSVSPNPDKNSSCETENGTKKRTSQDKEDGKNSCDGTGGGGGGSSIMWTVNTSGMDGTDYVNVCYARNVLFASPTYATAPQVCYADDPDFKTQITANGSWVYTFTPPDADTFYFVATPFSNGVAGTPYTGGVVGAPQGLGVFPGSCAVNSNVYNGYCSPNSSNIGVMSYAF